MTCFENATSNEENVSFSFQPYYIFFGYTNITLNGISLSPWICLHLSLFYQKMMQGYFDETSQFNESIHSHKELLDKFSILPYNGIINDLNYVGVVFYITINNYTFIDELCNFLNIPEGSQVARTEVTRFLIQYIQEHDLSHPEKKTLIIPNDALAKLLGPNVELDTLTRFTIQKYMNRHFMTA